MAIIGDAIKLITLKALIHVTTKPGATVTFKKGSTTMATKTANSSGVAELEVLSGDWGSWTITGSASPSASGSASVTLSAPTTYNVTLTLTQYIIQNGNFVSGFSHSVNAAGQPHAGASYFSDQGDYIELQTYQGGSNEVVSGYITTGIDMSGWNTLYIDGCGKGDSGYAGPANNTSDNPPSFSTSVQLFGQIESINSRSTKSLNVSGITGTKYLALRAKAWVWQDEGAGGTIRIYNMYLRN